MRTTEESSGEWAERSRILCQKELIMPRCAGETIRETRMEGRQYIEGKDTKEEGAGHYRLLILTGQTGA